MDRNDNGNAVAVSDLESLSARRAWIEIRLPWLFSFVSESLSARRAWIEIRACIMTTTTCTVALRKESVDRNPPTWTLTTHKIVALRKESVDRNFIELSPWGGWGGRSPQGERG